MQAEYSRFVLLGDDVKRTKQLSLIFIKIFCVCDISNFVIVVDVDVVTVCVVIMSFGGSTW